MVTHVTRTGNANSLAQSPSTQRASGGGRDALVDGEGQDTSQKKEAQTKRRHVLSVRDDVAHRNRGWLPDAREWRLECNAGICRHIEKWMR